MMNDYVGDILYINMHAVTMSWRGLKGDFTLFKKVCFISITIIRHKVYSQINIMLAT